MTKEEVLYIHQILIEKFGGATGVRDNKALEAAINRPYATFDKRELYPSAIDKAAAILESIVVNHPFQDGNKRTGYTLMRLILMQSGYDIASDQDEKYNFVLSISLGEMDIDQIKAWIKRSLVHHKL